MLYHTIKKQNIGPGDISYLHREVVAFSFRQNAAAERAADQDGVVIVVYRDRSHIAHVKDLNAHRRRRRRNALIPPKFIPFVGQFHHGDIGKIERVWSVPFSTREAGQYHLHKGWWGET